MRAFNTSVNLFQIHKNFFKYLYFTKKAKLFNNMIGLVTMMDDL